MSALRTAEEAAEHLGHITAATIRGFAKRGEIAYVKGARGKVLLTDAQIIQLVDHLTQPPRAPVVPERLPGGIDSLTSARSRALAGLR